MKEIFKNIKKESKILYRWARSRLLIYFRPKYVIRQVLARKGECGHHSCCGVSSFLKHRPCFDGKNCLKWGKDLPLTCLLYPIDEKDKADETRLYCSFYWDK